MYYIYIVACEHVAHLLLQLEVKLLMFIEFL